jgi:hypothetical protein
MNFFGFPKKSQIWPNMGPIVGPAQYIWPNMGPIGLLWAPLASHVTPMAPLGPPWHHFGGRSAACGRSAAAAAAAAAATTRQEGGGGGGARQPPPGGAITASFRSSQLVPLEPARAKCTSKLHCWDCFGIFVDSVGFARARSSQMVFGGDLLDMVVQGSAKYQIIYIYIYIYIYMYVFDYT